MSTNDAAQVRNSDLQTSLDRIEDKIDRKLDKMELKVDAATSRLDRIEGGLGMLKWLGPSGVVAVIAGIAKSMGLW